jgi:hypothetical protein
LRHLLPCSPKTTRSPFSVGFSPGGIGLDFGDSGRIVGKPEVIQIGSWISTEKSASRQQSVDHR